MGSEKSKVVICGIDHGEHSMQALRWALDYGIVGVSPSPTLPSSSSLSISSVSPIQEKKERDKLILLHVKTAPISKAALGGPGFVISADVLVSIEKNHEHDIDILMSHVEKICDERNVAFETKVISGDPRDAICEAVDEYNADLLVLGSHGYGAIKRVVLGSVSDYCAHHAKCPVLIVKKNLKLK